MGGCLRRNYFCLAIVSLLQEHPCDAGEQMHTAFNLRKSLRVTTLVLDYSLLVIVEEVMCWWGEPQVSSQGFPQVGGSSGLPAGPTHS